MQETTEPHTEEAEPAESIVEEVQRIVQTDPLPESVADSELKVLLINGPNLNLLGKRQPEIYGATTLKDIEEKITKRARELEVDVRCFQSNHEGAIVDFLQKEGPTARRARGHCAAVRRSAHHEHPRARTIPPPHHHG